MRLQNFEFGLVGPQLNEQALDDFEDEIGGAIDDSFREFLLAKNGGVLKPGLVSSIPQLNYKILVFHKLLEGFTSLRRGYFDLDEMLEVRNSSIRGLLPIASDSGYRHICISVGRGRSPTVIAN